MASQKVETQAGEIKTGVDEGWWASILAEDEKMLETPVESSQKQAAQPTFPKVEWDQVQAIFEQDEIVRLQVHGYNRGGLLVQGEGIQGFVPISHLLEVPASLSDSEKRQFLADHVGRQLQLKIIECDPKQERVVFSERAARAGEGRRKKLFNELKTGDLVSGSVTNVTEFGVFIDLGGVEGLIHVSELSWGRVNHPADILKVGQQVETMVLHISPESSKVALSLKRLQSNPWEVVVKRYNPGDVVLARITSVMRYGAFARLEEGVEGLIHISSILMPPGVKELEKILFTGQEVRVRILHIEVERRRLGLSLVAAG